MKILYKILLITAIVCVGNGLLLMLIGLIFAVSPNGLLGDVAKWALTTGIGSFITYVVITLSADVIRRNDP
jgi:hypothetical protein